MTVLNQCSDTLLTCARGSEMEMLLKIKADILEDFGFEDDIISTSFHSCGNVHGLIYSVAATTHTQYSHAATSSSSSVLPFLSPLDLILCFVF